MRLSSLSASCMRGLSTPTTWKVTPFTRIGWPTASMPGINYDGVGTERIPDTFDCAAEALTVGQQQHNRRNSPRHAEHGEQGLAEIVTHSAVSFGENIAIHRILCSAYSLLSASTGSSKA